MFSFFCKFSSCFITVSILKYTIPTNVCILNLRFRSIKPAIIIIIRLIREVLKYLTFD